MNKKFYPFIPIIAIFIIDSKSELDEYGLDNILIFVSSLIWQCICSYQITALILCAIFG